MAKEVVKKIKLAIEAGKANPAPPVGTVLGPAGINLQEFCTKFRCVISVIESDFFLSSKNSLNNSISWQYALIVLSDNDCSRRR